MTSGDLLTAGQSWRDRINVHPAADLFPMMLDEELIALGDDIEKNGLRDTCVFYGGEKRPENTAANARKRHEAKVAGKFPLLDGRNRLSAIERRGGRLERLIEDARVIYGDPFAYVVSTNLHRRHLSAEQNRELIEKLLKVQPEKSDRA